MKKLVVAGVAAVFAGVSLADDVAFPSAGGDFSSAEAWGGSIPTGRALFNQPGAYTASNDVTLNGVYINLGQNNDATFTVADGKTVTLNAALDLYAEKGYNNITFTGGTWDLTGNAFLPQNGYQDNRRNHYVLTLDGVTIANAKTMAMGYYAHSGYNTHALTNGASVTLSGIYQLAYEGKANNLLHISTGSRMTVDGAFMFNNAGTSPASTVIVEGEGSKLTAGSNSYLGKANGSQLIVRDGGSVSFGGGFWYMNNNDNTVFLDGAAESTFGPLYLTGSNNVFRLRNGSVASFGNSRIYLNNSATCTDCGFDIADSTFNFAEIQFGNATTNFFIRVSGPTGQAKFVNAVNVGTIFANTRLIFDLPVEGYADGVVPMSSSVRFGGGPTVKLEIENLAALREAFNAEGVKSRTYRIISSTAKDLYNMTPAINAANVRYAGCADFKIVDTDVAKCIDVTVFAGTAVSVGGTVTWPQQGVETYVITNATMDSTDLAGDLATLSVAENPEMLAVTDLHLIHGGDYTISSDMTVGAIDFWARNEPIVLDLSVPAVTVTPGRINFITESQVTIKGGTFEMGGKPFIPQNDWANNRRKDMTIVLDGTTVAGAGGSECLGYFSNSGNDTLVLTNGASYTHTGSKDNYFYLSYDCAGNNTMVVAGGSTFTVGPANNQFQFANTKASAPSTVLVTGEKSVFEMIGVLYLEGCSGHRLLVRDGAQLLIKQWWNFGGGGKVSANDCLVSIEDSPLSTLSSPYFCGTNNFIRLRNSTVTGSAVYLVGQDNGFDIADSSLSLTAIGFPANAPAATGPVLRFGGTHPELTVVDAGTSSTCALTRGGRLVYTLPPEGYSFDEEDRVAPFETQVYTYLNETTSYEVDNVEEIQDMLRTTGRRNVTYALSRFARADPMTAMLAHCNELAPAGVKYFFDATIGAVCVRIKNPDPIGMTVIVK